MKISALHISDAMKNPELMILLDELQSTRHENLEGFQNSPVITYLVKCLQPGMEKKSRQIQKREISLDATYLRQTIRQIEKDCPTILALCKELLELQRDRATGLQPDSIEHHLDKPLYKFIGQFTPKHNLREKRRR